MFILKLCQLLILFGIFKPIQPLIIEILPNERFCFNIENFSSLFEGSMVSVKIDMFSKLKSKGDSDYYKSPFETDITLYSFGKENNYGNANGLSLNLIYYKWTIHRFCITTKESDNVNDRLLLSVVTQKQQSLIEQNLIHASAKNTISNIIGNIDQYHQRDVQINDLKNRVISIMGVTQFYFYFLFIVGIVIFLMIFLVNFHFMRSTLLPPNRNPNSF